jgi:hypothetical protein
MTMKSKKKPEKPVRFACTHCEKYSVNGARQKVLRITEDHINGTLGLVRQRECGHCHHVFETFQAID